jgi:hypothetical protein
MFIGSIILLIQYKVKVMILAGGVGRQVRFEVNFQQSESPVTWMPVAYWGREVGCMGFVVLMV